MKRLGDVPFEFVVAGSVDPSVFGGSRQPLANVRYLGYVSDEQLKGLYRNALCFVFPSRYEGFGIPPLEAMAMGCPVVASSIDAVKEVCGDAARYFDPSNAEQLANLLRQVAADGDSRAHWVERGLDRAQLFSWRTAAKRVLDHLVQAYA